VLKNPIRAIVASYENLIVRLYAKIRFAILRQPFLEEIGQYLPRQGHILDLGCGFGLFSLYFAAPETGRHIVGIDLDARRINMARKSAEKLGLTNVSYEVSNVLEWDSRQRFDAIYLLDIVHHLPAERVPEFLSHTRARLKDNGLMIVKDVAPTPRYKMLFTLLLDRLVVGMEPIRYWPPHELMALLRTLGFEVVKHRMTDILPYPHILYICRPGGVDGQASS
jgi:2-polyprenyl-3-methyl-5-hydroxy-6-metoxy-1,4-benzoquinol methylase